MLRLLCVVLGSALALTAPAVAQIPALERFHDVLPAQDLNAATPSVAMDFDLDGDVDVVGGVAHEFLPGKRLWLNDGDAVFTEAAGAFPPDAVTQPSLDLVGADFDGDGLPEVFESRFDYAFRDGDALFHNLGGGVFADVSSALPADGRSTFAVVLDHDLDGDLDLYANGGRERLIENLGGLLFKYASPALPPGVHEPDAGSAGDLDGNGLPDLLLLSESLGSLDGKVLLNQGGAFALGAAFQTGDTDGFLPPVVELADLDGDQDLDAVIGTELEIGVNDGTGIFAFQPVSQPDPFPVISIAAGDVDGDLDQDLVVSGGMAVLLYPGSVWLYRNEGALSFTALPFPNPSEAAASDYQRGLLADLDGDQDLDYLRNGTRVVLGDGQGAFASSEDGLLVAMGSALGDLEGDGDPDLFHSTPLRFQRSGVAGLEAPVLIPLPGEAISAGDLDLDGDADLLVGYVTPTDPLVPALYQGDGSGAFSDGSAGLPSVAGHWASRLADVDGDGDLDGLLASLILNQGGGIFTDGFALMPDLGRFLGPEFTDVDADGDLDLVLAADGLIAPYRAQLLRNDGPLGFVDVTGVQLSQRGANAVAVGDVDLDGDQDLVFAREDQDGLQVNDGSGFFTDATAAGLPPDDRNGISAALLDLDADGDLDLYVGNAPWIIVTGGADAAQSQVLANDGMGVFTPEPGVLPQGFFPAFQPRPAGADFDRDGDIDLHVGDPVGLLANTMRHAAWSKPPRLGRPLELALRGDAGTPWVLLASSKTLDVPLGELGILGVDPSHPVILTAGMLDASGDGQVTFAVPSDPTLVGQSLFWQAIVGSPRKLTNVERTAFTDF